MSIRNINQTVLMQCPVCLCLSLSSVCLSFLSLSLSLPLSLSLCFCRCICLCLSVCLSLSLSVYDNDNDNRIQRRYSRFFTISSARRSVSSTNAHVARAQSCANHVQHIERLSRASVMLRATWYEGAAQL